MPSAGKWVKKSVSIDVKYAFQDPNELPTPHKFPKNRTKPWGTAHAVRAASSHIDGPFAVANADDFYGLDAYKNGSGAKYLSRIRRCCNKYGWLHSR